MRIGLIGPLQSGKSTLFTAITGHRIDPAQLMQDHLGSVDVPDPRLDFLVDLYKPKKRTEAKLDFVDVPGFSLETPQQQDDFRRHFAALRQCDGLLAVVRDFADPTVPAYRNRVDAGKDLEELWTEMIFADLETVTHRIQKLDKMLSRPSKTSEQEKTERAFMTRLSETLEAESSVASVVETDEERRWISSYQFLTQMPLVAVINVDEERAAEPAAIQSQHAHSVIPLCAKTEAEIAQLDQADRRTFLDDLGVGEPARDRLIRACYDAIGLISFLTYGEDECRAWTIRRGDDAVAAAGKIHSDIARGFIRAETVAFADLKECGDFKAAKAAGKVRLEGKHYVVDDGDAILFRFNV